MEDSKQQLLAQLRDATNVLVTVTSNPSVDQLAGAIGFTLLLNKLGKHATAIFSGQVPDVLEFLKPEATLEKNADSLRDFIVALDKAKADKLRYKVEDTMVKIFITPYHTAITEKDLEFSQGDYNVDLVVALGAHDSKDLDQAIVSHGRILHDAVVSSINNQAAGNLGTINWVDAGASSLCEMIFDLIQTLQPEGGVDPQMATALLTGIVSETRRFGNEKTTAKSLETSSLLVAAGANQQLVAAKLEEKPAPIPEKKAAPKPVVDTADPNAPGATDTHKDPEAVPQTAGTVTINHDDDQKKVDDQEEIHIDEEGKLHADDTEDLVDSLPAPSAAAQPEAKPVTSEPESALESPGPKIVLDPPSFGGQLTASGDSPTQDSMVDPLSNSVAENTMPLLSHDSGPAKAGNEEQTSRTLSQIEESVASPHVGAPVLDDALTPDVDAARNAVEEVSSNLPDPLPKPVEALNAQHIDLDTPTPADPATVPEPPHAEAEDTAMPSMSFTTTTPPPVPPPMMPPTFGSSSEVAATSDESQQNTDGAL